MYRIELTAEAKKELKNLSKLHSKAISLAIDELKEDPTLGKPLGRELTGLFSLRVSNYRIIYKINKVDKKILVLRAGHRSKVYS